MSTTAHEALEAEWNGAIAQVIGEARLHKRVAEPELERLVSLCSLARTSPLTPVQARRLIGSARSIVHSLVAEADHADGDAQRALEEAAERLDEAVRALAEVHERP